MNKLRIKPLSTNQCWQGKRFSTPAYKSYIQEMLYILPKINVPQSKQLFLYIEVGFSSKLADIDNVLKPFIDCLQKKYGFNDRDIYELQVVKEIVKKGEEYVHFDIGSLCSTPKVV